MLFGRLLPVGLVAAATFSGGGKATSPAGDVQTAPTGLDLIGWFEQLSLSYIDLTSSLQELLTSSQREEIDTLPGVKTLFETYKNITELETKQANGPQPPQLNELEQYILLVTSYEVAAVDKAFLEALIAAKPLFQPFAQPLVGLLKTQQTLLDAWKRDVKVFAPKIADTIIASDQSLVRSLNKAIDAYGSVLFPLESQSQYEL